MFSKLTNLRKNGQKRHSNIEKLKSTGLSKDNQIENLKKNLELKRKEIFELDNKSFLFS